MQYKEGEVLVLDIETSDLLEPMIDHRSFPYKLHDHARLWCISIRDYVSDKEVMGIKEQITKEWMQEQLKNAKILVLHHGHKFDLVALRLFGVLDYHIGYPGEDDLVFGRPCKILDTNIISRLLNPDRPGGHSLKAWGKRTGFLKIGYRQECIDKGYISKDSPKGEEFKEFRDELIPYCSADTIVGKNTFKALSKELRESPGNWTSALKMEHKLADIAIKRETLGFHFDKELAFWCFDDLTKKMEELASRIEPNLPPCPLGITEQKGFIPPKTQFKKDGTLSAHIIKFADRIGGKIVSKDKDFFIEFEDKRFKLPYTSPVKTHRSATVKDSDHVKQTLINKYGWNPSEWRIRDLTVDSKKKKLSYKKRIKALQTWINETAEGKYQKHRLEIVYEDYKVQTLKQLVLVLQEKLKKDWPVRVPTSPSIKTGVMKELCPNLVKLGEKVSFAKDFSDYSTYKSRRSDIAGGKDVEERISKGERPEKGFLSTYREEDQRISTPSLEIGASSHRMVHLNVVNVPRVDSLYGKYMRSLFCAGDGFIQLGFDAAGLEARVEGHYVLPYPGGPEMAKSLVAEKPNDIHSVNARKLDIPRDNAKSVKYGLTYGAAPPKVGAMLGLIGKAAVDFYKAFWESVAPLRDLRDAITRFWKTTGKQEFIPTIDGRLIQTRSAHSLINYLFQSTGVIFMKYLSVRLYQLLERKGLNIDPFAGEPDACEMIAYHDEEQIAMKPSLCKFKTFQTEEEAKEFVKNWDISQGQLSDISKSEKGFYVALPNVVSETIQEALEFAEKLLKFRVKMGQDWKMGRNWADCH